MSRLYVQQTCVGRQVLLDPSMEPRHIRSCKWADIDGCTSRLLAVYVTMKASIRNEHKQQNTSNPGMQTFTCDHDYSISSKIIISESAGKKLISPDNVPFASALATATIPWMSPSARNLSGSPRLVRTSPSSISRS